MKRNLLQHLVDIKMDTTYEASEYHLLGEGIESLTEEFNAEEETVQWINQANGTTDLRSYTPSIEVERQNVDQDDAELTAWIDNIIDTLPTGKEAVTSYLRVRITGEGPEYPAVRRQCVIMAGSTGGDAGANVTDVITLGGRGDGVAGTFNASTKKFTATGGSLAG
jgi:hypothetical protein